VSCNEIILQIFAGGFTGTPAAFEEVEGKLISVLDRLPVRKVIMGWSTGRGLYEKTAAFLAKRNIGFYLWFPVFSETGALRSLGGLLDYRGRRQEKRKTTGEDFSFCCPGQAENTEKILGIFEKEFASIPFNGIFLDKIRFPSFAQSSEQSGVFTCFCPRCLDMYEEENFDVRRLVDILSRKAGASPLGITAYRGGGYMFEDQSISGFFSLKARVIFRSMERICRYFREKGFGIGFDVFAPFLSPFVGQDLAKLSGLCDFMKPMMYRATQAPAGLPFEAEMLLRETAGNDTGKRRLFFKFLGIDQGSSDPGKPFDLAFSARELETMAAASACPVYAGVEINRMENIAEVFPDYIEETLVSFARTGIRGFVLSWNLLNAPPENIAKAAEIMERFS
jgi:hypothetical protein